MRILSLLLLLSLLTECQESTASFDAFPLPRAVNLARVLGPEPVLLGLQDTLALRLHFDAATGRTEFSMQEDSTMHSWFTARAFRFRGLYYLVEERSDARCWVQAVRIQLGQVQGLGTGYHQMQALSQAVWQGAWPQLLVSTDDSMRLRFNRQQLRKFYAEEVDRFTTYRLAGTSGAQAAARGANFTPARLISLYPNPASTSATVVFQDTAAHQVQLYDEQGRILQSYATAAHQQSFPVADLPAGTYLVRIQPAGGGPATMLRLAVAH